MQMDAFWGNGMRHGNKGEGRERQNMEQKEGQKMKKTIAVMISVGMMILCAGAQAETEWIKTDMEFGLEEPLQAEYPAVMVRGEAEYDAQGLLEALLGEGYREEAEGRFVEDKEGEIWEIKQARIDGETGEISYYDPMVSSERGAEYEPPALGMSPEEAEARCRELLGEVLPEEMIGQSSEAYRAIDRWHGEDDRGMDEEEYEAFFRERKLGYFRFEHREASLAILGEGVTASIGANGLNGLTLNRHGFTASEETAELMPLEEALEMADSTRSAPAQLLYAQPVYSNWVSGDERYHLSWYLVTGSGNYVVDCVLREHTCDSWES